MTIGIRLRISHRFGEKPFQHPSSRGIRKSRFTKSLDEHRFAVQQLTDEVPVRVMSSMKWEEITWAIRNARLLAP